MKNMKKWMLVSCLGVLTSALSSCTMKDLDVKHDAGASYSGIVEQVKVSDKIRLEEATVKDGSYYSYRITPTGFDYDELNRRNFRYMMITVHYYVSYKRTFTGWDIFYKGAPKYDISIKNDDDTGNIMTGLEIKNDSEKTISYQGNLSEIRTEKIKFTIGSINIQNEIYFTNMTVEYSVN